MLSRVRLISVAAVVMAVGAAPGPAVAAERAGSTDIPSTVADAYSRTYNVSVDVARTRLRVQYRGLDLENELRRALGEGFGGLAFDNDAAGYQVFVTREQDRPEVERLLAERNLSATSEVVGVRSTWHELEAGRDSVVAKLSHLIADREAQVGLSAVDNAVRVLIPNTLANSRYELVRNVAERASVNVVIEKANPSEFKVVEPAHIPTARSRCEARLRLASRTHIGVQRASMRGPGLSGIWSPPVIASQTQACSGRLGTLT